MELIDFVETFQATLDHRLNIRDRDSRSRPLSS